MSKIKKSISNYGLFIIAMVWGFGKNCIFMSEVGCEMESLGKFDKNFGETLERELEWSHFLRKRA